MAFEELVAEIASCFLCVRLGLTPEPRPDHAQYLASWVKAFQDDKRAIVTAAAAAGSAADYLMAMMQTLVVDDAQAA